MAMTTDKYMCQPLVIVYSSWWGSHAGLYIPVLWLQPRGSCTVNLHSSLTS